VLFSPFRKEASQVAHLKHSTWKMQWRAFMTRSVQLISRRHREQLRAPPYSLKVKVLVIEPLPLTILQRKAKIFLIQFYTKKST
jgi:hypothetical protein